MLHNVPYIVPFDVYGKNEAIKMIECRHKNIPRRDKIIIIKPCLIRKAVASSVIVYGEHCNGRARGEGQQINHQTN